jgi:hypothetical protein
VIFKYALKLKLSFSGSILGGILLVASLYTMLWGKSKEVKTDDVTHDTEKAEHKKSAESLEEQHHTTAGSRNQH